VIARGEPPPPFEGHLHHRSDVPGELRLVADLARGAGGGGLVLLPADVTSGPGALALLVAEPPHGTAALGTGPGHGGPAAYELRAPRGRVLAAASPYHWVGTPTGSFAGLLRVGAGDEAELAAAAERLAELVAGASLDGRRPEAAAPPSEDVPALLLTALVRAGVPVALRDLRSFAWARAGQPAADPAQDERARLDAAVKPADGFFTTFFVSSYSRYIARFAARLGITPNQVTLFSMVVGALAAAAFAFGHRWSLIAGALLLYAAFTFDCVDGQLARYTRNFSRFGAWLDSVLDRGKEYLVYAGLAVGSVRGFGFDAWPLAAAALTLQTARHMVEFAYWDVHYRAIEEAPQPPLAEPGDRPGAPPAGVAGGVSAATLGFSRWLDRPPGIHWIKKMLVFPIGERFAAISVTAAVWSPRVTFLVVLAWGGIAAAYSVAAHVMHSAGRVPGAGRRVSGPVALAFRDDGPIAVALSRLIPVPLPAPLLVLLGAVPLVVAVAVGGAFVRHWALLPGLFSLIVLGAASARRPDGRFDWAVPGMLRGLEYGLLLWMAVLAHGDAVKACFALLAVLAFHHYDAVYRLRQNARPVPPWLRIAGGWDGRLVLAYIALLAAASTVGMAVAAALFAILFVGESATAWLAESRSSQPPQEAYDE
jgi:uncharacterized protein DUF5941/CDP-alcohol phosphatidyltransferase-like enzyme